MRQSGTDVKRPLTIDSGHLRVADEQRVFPAVGKIAEERTLADVEARNEIRTRRIDPASVAIRDEDRLYVRQSGATPLENESDRYAAEIEARTDIVRQALFGTAQGHRHPVEGARGLFRQNPGKGRDLAAGVVQFFFTQFKQQTGGRQHRRQNHYPGEREDRADRRRALRKLLQGCETKHWRLPSFT